MFHQETKSNLLELCLCRECRRTQLCVFLEQLGKLRKLSRRECFSCLRSAAFRVWLWVRMESLLHFLQNHSSDNHFVQLEGNISSSYFFINNSFYSTTQKLKRTIRREEVTGFFIWREGEKTGGSLEGNQEGENDRTQQILTVNVEFNTN